MNTRVSSFVPLFAVLGGVIMLAIGLSILSSHVEKDVPILVISQEGKGDLYKGREIRIPVVDGEPLGLRIGSILPDKEGAVEYAIMAPDDASGDIVINVKFEEK